MSSERPNQTLADYVALAISPALLMGLVGSLVFFLLEVLYSEKGEYKDRLQWILFFFVFGAVLVARISMTQGVAGRAGLYGLVLAGLTFAGMQIYVEYPKGSAAASLSWLINLSLVGLAWWCAHRLTWDCTQIDEETEVGGEGLLQATGLEKPAGSAAATKPAEAAETKDERSPGWFIGWWERFELYREERKKRRVLGGWVIYFSLAALPLFGLGEALIPVEETGRRQYAFWLMAAYVGSGLGLLATTCFLSLRRYLRQRRLQMPAAMTAAWLTAGGGLIAALLLIGALLPRPRPEYSLLPYPSAGSDKRAASNFAGQGGSSGQGEGRRIGDQPKDKGDSGAADKDAQATGRDKGSPAQDKDKGDAAGEKHKDGSSKGADKESSEKDKGDGSNRDKGNESSNPQQQPQKDGPRPRDDKAADQPKDKPAKSDQQSSANSQPNSPPNSPRDWTSALSSVATVLKWIVFALLILAVIFFVLREGLKFLANFTDWARNLLNALSSLWANLFKGRAKQAKEEEGESGPAQRGEAVKPFAAYANPFRDGGGERRPVKEIVKYTFAALQAWAREHNVERRPGETPLEFAARLGEEYPGLEADVRRFTLLYARAVYDYGPLSANSLDAVRAFWKRLETAAEQPMSA